MAKKAKAKVSRKQQARSAKAPKATARKASPRKAKLGAAASSRAKKKAPAASKAKAAPKRRPRGELGGAIEPRPQRFPGAQGAGPAPVADINPEIESDDRLERGEPAEAELEPPYGAEDEDEMLEKESA